MVVPLLQVDTTHLNARLDSMNANVREALVKVLGPISRDIAADARSRASAHIRFLGIKPGDYVNSIYGGVSDKRTDRITGYVRSASPLAHLMEYGANIPPHDILPSVAQALAFGGGAGTVFAKIVHSPGAKIPPYPAILPAFEARKEDIKKTITETVKSTAGKR